MSLPDTPIAHEGFFATHFFTGKDQEKSKDFYVCILGGDSSIPQLEFGNSNGGPIGAASISAGFAPVK